MLDNDRTQSRGPELKPVREFDDRALGMDRYSFGVGNLMFLDSYINEAGITMLVWGFILKNKPAEARIFEAPSTLGCVADAIGGTTIGPLETIPLEKLSPGVWYYVGFAGVHTLSDMGKVGMKPEICEEVYAGLQPSAYSWVRDFFDGREASATEINDLSGVLTVYSVPEVSD